MSVTSNEFERLQKEAHERGEVYVDATPIGERLRGSVRSLLGRGSSLEGLSTEELEQRLVSARGHENALESRRYQDYHRGVGAEIREMKEESAAARRRGRLEKALKRKQE